MHPLELTIKTVVGAVLFGALGIMIWTLREEFKAMQKEYRANDNDNKEDNP